MDLSTLTTDELKAALEAIEGQKDFEENDQALEMFKELNIFYDSDNNKYCAWDDDRNRLHSFSKTDAQDRLLNYIRSKGIMGLLKKNVILDAVPTKYREFAPGQKMFFTRNDEDYWNSYRDTKYLKMIRDCKALGDTLDEMPEVYKALLDNLISDKDTLSLLLHNLSYHMQTFDPAGTFFYVLGLIGGEGKGNFFEIIMKEIYGVYWSKASGADIKGKWTDYMVDNLFLMVDELQDKMNQNDVSSFHNSMKSIVSNDSVMVEVKNQSKRIIKNHSIVIVATNSMNALNVDNKDRRLNAVTCGNKTFSQVGTSIGLGDTDFVQELKNQIPDFIRYLAGIELNQDRYASEVVTTALTNIVNETSLRPEVLLAEAIISQDKDKIKEVTDETPELHTFFIASQHRIHAGVPGVIYAKELIRKELDEDIYRALGSYMKARGIASPRIKTAGVASQVWFVPDAV